MGPIFRTSHTTNRDSHFTMIEMLVVLAIVSVMMGIGIAVSRRMGKSQGSRAGARRMADMIALARQKAILNNTRVALLLPGKSVLNSSHDKTLPTLTDKASDDPGRLVGICEVDKTSKFVRWIEGTSWVELPEQSYFTCVCTNKPSWPVSVIDVQLPQSSTPSRSDAVIFMPNGTLPSNIFDSDVGAEIWVKPFSSSSNKYELGSANKYKITVNWLTGMATTESRR